MAQVFAAEIDHDVPGVAIPRAEAHVVVRFGPSAEGGIDVYAMGVRESVHRKLLRRGHRTLMARLELSVFEPVLAVSAASLAGRTVPLAELWGARATRELVDRLAAARDARGAIATLKRAIAQRVTAPSAGARLAVAAAGRLTQARVHEVAEALGVSERHLRRVFVEHVGVSPKAFARLKRFRAALAAARGDQLPNWARVALEAGYYDQAHLIAEFRAIAGATPRALVEELRGAREIG